MIDEYLKKYAERFGDRFPMYQLGRTRSDAEIVSIIKRCLSENKSAYDLGLVDDDDEDQY